MKNSIVILFTLILLVSCSSNRVIKQNVVKTFPAVVVSQSGVLVGEFSDGAKIIKGNAPDDLIVWEGYKLILRSESGNSYEHLSHDLYYEGDKLLITVKNGKVVQAKYRP